MTLYQPKPVQVFTFDEFVAHGLSQAGQEGVNIVDGVPWAFDFMGYAVTHENDETYLISQWMLQPNRIFRAGEMLVVKAFALPIPTKDGGTELAYDCIPIRSEVFAALYDAVAPSYLEAMDAATAIPERFLPPILDVP